MLCLTMEFERVFGDACVDAQWTRIGTVTRMRSLMT